MRPTDYLFSVSQGTRERVIFKWSSKGNFLAIAGEQRKVAIYNRGGRKVADFSLPPAESKEYGPSVIDMAWDSTGTKLAIAPRGLPCIVIWTTAFMDATNTVSTDVRDLTFISWDPSGSSVVAGSGKGHVVIYNEYERRKVVYAGIHSKAVTHGAWGPNGLIGVAGEDSVISLIKAVDGSVVSQIVTPKKPTDVHFASKRGEGPFGVESPIMSAVVGNMLYVIDIDNPSAVPLAFKFSGTYGSVRSYAWLSSTFVAVAFETGQIVGYSTARSDQEVYAMAAPSRISSLGFSTRTGQMAIVCGRSLRVYQVTQAEVREVREMAMDFDLSQTLDSVAWTADGQILTASTAMGDVLSYLVTLPVVHGASGTRVAYLNQLTQVSVVDSRELSGTLDGGEGKAVPILCDIEPEPESIGLGPEHLAASLNNKVWYYRIGEQPGIPASLVGVRDFVGSVQGITLTGTHAAVLSNGKVIVHLIENLQGGDAEPDTVLPLTMGQGASVSCIAAAGDFVIYGTSEGIVAHYAVAARAAANEYRHQRAIERVFPNPTGSRVIFQDANNGVFMFSPVSDTMVEVPEIDTAVAGCFWDQSDPTVFVLYDTTHIRTYLHNPNAVSGPPITRLNTNPVPDTHVPLVLLQGQLVCQLRSSPRLESLLLRSHQYMGSMHAADLSAQELEQRFSQALVLRRFGVAAEAAAVGGTRALWERLFQAALEGLEIPIAIRAARALGDAGIVMTLEAIRHVEDRALLAGHVALILQSDAELAQELFLRSSQPQAALRMRFDMGHWEQAMVLAREMEPSLVSRIAKELGQLNEMRGEYDNALSQYELCLDQELKRLPDAQDAGLLGGCRAGLCRCLARQGQVRRAVQIAIESSSSAVCGECGAALEALGHLPEAADMFLRAGRTEKAAEIYLTVKNYDAAGPLMASIQSPKLQAMYARAKEAEGRLNDAVAAYELAGETVQVIRVLLEKIRDPGRAFIVARRTKSVEGAIMCAQYCKVQNTEQFKPLVVEFLCLGGALEEALGVAKNLEQVEAWETHCGEGVPSDLLEKAAVFWEDAPRRDFARAAGCYLRAGMYQKALRNYLRLGLEGIDRALNVVEESKSRELGAEMLDYITRNSELANDPRLFRTMYRVQMAQGRYDEAAGTILEIVKSDQDEGNYRVAHQHLLEMSQLLGQQGRKVPTKLTQALQLLHSYILVKVRVKLEDHLGAARLLVRVARSITRFPKHVVPILTSTVIECQRAGLAKTSLEQAATLMRPEYRNEINPNYKRKIEAMVRKPDRDARDPDEELAPCPSCRHLGPEYDLECGACKNLIPMCIASGRRMVAEGREWSQCPNCLMHCRMGEMKKVLADGGTCPMCTMPIDPVRLVTIPNPLRQGPEEGEAA